MKLNTVFLLFCFLTVFAKASESHPEFPDYEIVSKVANSELKAGRTKMIFNLYGLPSTGSPQRLVWSANKWIDTVWMDESRVLSKILISGKYNFKFYYNSEYKEIIIPKMSIESGYTITVNLNFKSSKRENMQVKKPVIYLYPEEPTDVQLKIDPVGELTFSYPIYSPDGWNVRAEPDGTLHTSSGALNYLFWESEQAMRSISTSVGWIVPKDSTVVFLEDKLSAFGLNNKEKADFITFWGPELLKNQSNFVQFIFNEDCDQFAELEIDPKPEHVYRIYLLFAPSDQLEFSLDGLPEQKIPKINRDGFTVIEWGGSELSYPQP